MRRLALIGFMLSMLTACGRVSQPTLQPANLDQESQTSSYPTPLSATSEPIQDLPDLTAIPTVTNTDPAPLQVYVEKSYPVASNHIPTVLSGWSPNNQYLLYAQATSVDTNVNALVGRLLILDIQKSNVSVITSDTVSIAVAVDGQTYNGNLPRWTEECCTIAATFIEQQQQFKLIDQTGHPIKTLTTASKGLFHYAYQSIQQIEQNKIIWDGKPQSEQLISKTGWITSTNLTNDGLYAHTQSELQYIGKSDSWVIQSRNSFLKENLDHTIFQVTPSIDGSWIAVVTSANQSWDRALWIIDRETQTANLVDENYKLGEPSWSADNRYLIYSIDGSMTIYDQQTKQKHKIEGKFEMSAVWHPNESMFALINREKSRIDIFRVEQ
ncbi:hypothetical protein [Herpetosiphon gulosus]|uniref:WD40 repeat domain-containing protein n=1 Tax=Herpetosiphon gulosus TaxID=1973496 RepID=A0ABP9X0G6_9CHLR